MGNTITHRALDPDGESAVHLSDGETSVLLSVLVLAGSHLAQDDWERRLVMWFATRDQSIVGVGTVGFDLSHFAWKEVHFTRQKKFVLSMIDLALRRHGWDRLGYEPPHVEDTLLRLRTLVSSFEPQHIGAGPPRAWPWHEERTDFPRCAEHDVVLGFFETCLLCNERVQAERASEAEQE
jgi:hypothetical protein